MIEDHLSVHQLGLQPYQDVWQSMSQFTDSRDESTWDQLWLVQHPSVFTQGQAGKAEHVLNAGDIPIVQSDRGGQVTYHGPGQLIVYPLINLRRRQIGVRDMVSLLEAVAIELLDDYGVKAYAKPDAPGVYIEGSQGESKIASLGLRVRRGCSFHGMSINVDMDLSPFARINPCGYQGMQVTQLKDVIEAGTIDVAQVEKKVIHLLATKLKASQLHFEKALPACFS